ncbi:MAG: alpha/beta hydrolase [Oscillospiraceae bacterium]|nr:alpha/beta hydrolase [Oscillospiraceae bacterium]
MDIRSFFAHLTFLVARKKARKKKPWIGSRFLVPREGKKAVETFLYYPEESPDASYPVLFNIHGGAWLWGDATGQDSLCQFYSEKLKAFVVNINYTKVDDKRFPYMQNEIIDTVQWFYEHSVEYKLDRSRFSVIGYSAGGNLAAGTVFELLRKGISLNSVVLGYPFLDFRTMESLAGEKLDPKMKPILNDFFLKGGEDLSEPLYSPLAADAQEIKKLPPTMILGCEKDSFGLYPHATKYRDLLIECGVPVTFLSYPEASHGFIEHYWPEYKGTYREEQKNYRDEALNSIVEWIKDKWHF